jgi:chorismate-pyruvate lyase
MKKKHFAIIAGLMAIVIVVLALRPVPIPAEKDCLVLKGTVTKIYEGGVKDVVIELNGHNQKFYVNRGLQRGLNLQELQSKLTGSEIVLKYPDHWTPLDPGKSIIHISKIEHERQTVFTELN